MATGVDVSEAKQCPRCKQTQPVCAFSKNRSKKDGLALQCKYCCKRWKAKWRSNPINKERQRQWAKANYFKHRIDALKAYGGDYPKCTKCGETTEPFLCIDHVNGGGCRHRNAIGPANVYKWLKDHGYPIGYQVLCHNCNEGKNPRILKNLNDKKVVLAHYGGKCSCCGEDKIACLCIHHVHEDGAKMRKLIPSQFTINQWLIKNDFPVGFDTLCYNCNRAIEFLGSCPHESVTCH